MCIRDRTPQAVRAAARDGQMLVALVGALRLGDRELQAEVYEHVPVGEVPLVAAQLPRKHLETVLGLVAARLNPASRSPHVEFHLLWLTALFNAHGELLRGESATTYAPVLRAVQMALNELRSNVKRTSDENTAAMLYVWSGLPRVTEAEGL